MSKMHNGGYFLNAEPVIRCGVFNRHSALDLSKTGAYAIKALNLIQDTPWQVNPFVLDTVSQLQDQKRNLGFEPRRVCRRLQLLSRMEHHEQDDEQVFP